ncbi:hypothetical protein PPERSA_07126 [Pseudocohnilembus persalinus]|uniref:GPI inositol-deacylase PGAP1-like alpha/beta domain-containing protein n=1 Tax=Pseudocohnilembus persalinus TaxID=266149 RepID=A0A0V0QX45_PSEPJ|nr:hypothetical protein PPERSA_07126 [Pseudocohnilembus persalinus]|eukprot:KRX06963.1 hypothetical protein PPERSA_07126 [Pseudocohnilembus persalinus]
MKVEPLKLISCIIIVIGAVMVSSTLFYGLNNLQDTKAKQIMKYFQFQKSQYNPKISIKEIIFDGQDQFYPFRFFEINHQAQQKQDILETRRESLFPFLFIPGHKTDYTDIIPLIGQIFDLEEILGVSYQEKNFKFYSIDFRYAPSLYSGQILEKESIFIEKCIIHLKNIMQITGVQNIGQQQNGIQNQKPVLKIICHSFGGIGLLNSFINLQKSDIEMIKEIIFLNSPLSSHPHQIHKSLSEIYQDVYKHFENNPKKLENIQLISISGSQQDGVMLQQHSYFQQNFPNKYYHFFTNNIKEVYTALNHTEILKFPPFLMQLSKYILLDTIELKQRQLEPYIFFQDQNPYFERYLFYKHYKQQIYSNQNSDLTDPLYRSNCIQIEIYNNYKNEFSKPLNSERYSCIKLIKQKEETQNSSEIKQQQDNQKKKQEHQNLVEEIQFVMENNIYPENMIVYVMTHQNQEFLHIIKPQYNRNIKYSDEQQVIHPLNYLVNKIGKLLLFQSILMLVANFSLDAFLNAFLGLGLTGLQLFIFTILTKFYKIVFGKVPFLYGIIFSIAVSVYVGKWLALPLIMGFTVGGNSKNIAFTTFCMAYYLVLFNIFNIYILNDEGEYNDVIVDQSEGNLDYACIVVWLFSGYQVDQIGSKNKKYIQTALVCIICIINFFTYDGLHYISTLLNPFSIFMAFRFAKDIVLDLLKR